MKIYEIISFNQFYKEIADKEMPIKLAYQFTKILTEIQPDIDFYQKELQKIFDDCVEQENGEYKMSPDKQNYIVIKDKIPEFEKRFQELRELEVEFNDNLKLDISLLEDMKITPNEILKISNFLK